MQEKSVLQIFMIFKTHKNFQNIFPHKWFEEGY